MNRKFWRDKKVLVTGHTGFKGSWTVSMLDALGASVKGVALACEDELALWPLIAEHLSLESNLIDLRDADAVRDVVEKAAPEIVIHLAAQAQVRRAYRDPVETYSTNLMGTVNLLEVLRPHEGLKAVLVVTSDKVYRNLENDRQFTEGDHLGGSDPYSASKAACELIVRSYSESYFAPRGVPLATARAGNVIGGGDWASDRLVPDIFRAAKLGVPVELRYPSARRPWQHVLDCLDGYLCYAEYLYEKGVADPAELNFGPEAASNLTVAELAEDIGGRLGNSVSWILAPGQTPPEKLFLSLDAGMARRLLGWSPKLDMRRTIDWTADWYESFARGETAPSLVNLQIRRYLQEFP